MPQPGPGDVPRAGYPAPQEPPAVRGRTAGACWVLVWRGSRSDFRVSKDLKSEPESQARPAGPALGGWGAPSGPTRIRAGGREGPGCGAAEAACARAAAPALSGCQARGPALEPRRRAPVPRTAWRPPAPEAHREGEGEREGNEEMNRTAACTAAAPPRRSARPVGASARGGGPRRRRAARDAGAGDDDGESMRRCGRGVGPRGRRRPETRRRGP